MSDSFNQDPKGFHNYSATIFGYDNSGSMPIDPRLLEETSNGVSFDAEHNYMPVDPQLLPEASGSDPSNPQFCSMPVELHQPVETVDGDSAAGIVVGPQANVSARDQAHAQFSGRGVTQTNNETGVQYEAGLSSQVSNLTTARAPTTAMQNYTAHFFPTILIARPSISQLELSLSSLTATTDPRRGQGLIVPSFASTEARNEFAFANIDITNTTRFDDDLDDDGYSTCSSIDDDETAEDHIEALRQGIDRLNNDNTRFYSNGYVERIPRTSNGYIIVTKADAFFDTSNVSDQANSSYGHPDIQGYNMGEQVSQQWNPQAYPQYSRGGMEYSWPDERIRDYVENGWQIPLSAFQGHHSSLRSKCAPANTFFGPLDNIEITAHEILTFAPLCTAQFGIINRLASAGMTNVVIADSINHLRDVNPPDFLKADTVKHQLIPSDKKRHGANSWTAACKKTVGKSKNPPRPLVQDFTARVFRDFQNEGEGFKGSDREHPNEDPYLILLGAGVDPEKFPQGQYRGILTLAIEFAVKHDLKEERLSGVPNLIKRYGLDRLVSTAPLPRDLDKKALADLKNMIKPFKKHLSQTRSLYMKQLIRKPKEKDAKKSINKEKPIINDNYSNNGEDTSTYSHEDTTSDTLDTLGSPNGPHSFKTSQVIHPEAASNHDDNVLNSDSVVHGSADSYNDPPADESPVPTNPPEQEWAHADPGLNNIDPNPDDLFAIHNWCGYLDPSLY
ncbi:hypothetical protein B0J11DRAFT_578348 [Dendryphion nanum]|uniref:Uncharacterized protein n=1 Tax=Dendryphion nanum TaxID=256645 RepID=A0A9P9DZM9_9PLEO|nr:hypothetical protein B0J11DRAFT_578348 [Dendryphion nanum]